MMHIQKHPGRNVKNAARAFLRDAFKYALL